ncbi:phage baseplate assembly protein V [Kribbella sp. NPDC051952]|uniref:phage baseplate assembly protein V n=1 Tax=Kribbella sp. NPDC051952 TaxID=3154851 RepID=UPI0034157FEB
MSAGMSPGMGIGDGGTDGGPRHYGLYPAVVTQLTGDPLHLQRIQVRFPWLGKAGETVRAWATVLSLYADNDQGFQALPEKDSAVVVGFEAGDIERPYLVGAMWTGKATMPVAPSDDNNQRVLRTRSGSRLVFDDTKGSATVSLSVAGAASDTVHKIVFDDAADTIEITSKGKATVKLTSGGGVSITALTSLSITAPTVKIDSPMVKCSGVVKCESVITNATVSSLYTTGAGNIL